MVTDNHRQLSIIQRAGGRKYHLFLIEDIACARRKGTVTIHESGEEINRSSGTGVTILPDDFLYGGFLFDLHHCLS
jgi:hypothetical protein